MQHTMRDVCFLFTEWLAKRKLSTHNRNNFHLQSLSSPQQLKKECIEFNSRLIQIVYMRIMLSVSADLVAFVAVVVHGMPLGIDWIFPKKLTSLSPLLSRFRLLLLLTCWLLRTLESEKFRIVEFAGFSLACSLFCESLRKWIGKKFMSSVICDLLTYVSSLFVTAAPFTT